MVGGLAPMVKNLDAPYDKLYGKIAQRNKSYYAKFPEDVQRLKTLARYLAKQDEGKLALPSGSNLSVPRLRQLGILLGFHGGVDTIHEMIFRMHNDLEMFDLFTRPTLAAFENLTWFNESILYALLHEPCYLQGAAANWSAERMMKCHPEFLNTGTENSDEDSNRPILFTGEMIYREMFQDFDELRPLLDTADVLAKNSDWPDLYDEAQFAKNEVPVYAASYIDDMYVDYGFAKDTASQVQGLKTFETNRHYHDALSGLAEESVKQLFALRDDVID